MVVCLGRGAGFCFYLSSTGHLGSPGQNPKSRKAVVVVVKVKVKVVNLL